MAPSPLKKKRDHTNKTANPQPPSSSKTDESNHGNNNKKNDTDDMDAFCDMDKYDSDMTKKDRLFLPKRTFIDIESMDTDFDAESNTNNYELIDTDDDLGQQQTLTGGDDDKDKDKNSKQKQRDKKRSTSISLSLSSASKPKEQPETPVSTTYKKRRLDDLEDDIPSSKDATTTTAAASNKKHTDHEPAVLPDATDDLVPSLPKSKQGDTSSKPPKPKGDGRWDPGSKYEVESILQHKMYRSRVLRYEVKWKGYPDSENTWEPAGSLHEDCRAFVLNYWRSLPQDVIWPGNIPLEPTLDSTSDKDTATTTRSTKGKMKDRGVSNEVISLDDDDDDEFLASNDDDGGDAIGSEEKETNSSSSSSNNSSDIESELGPGKTIVAAAGLATHAKKDGLSTTTTTTTTTAATNDDVYKEIARQKNIKQKHIAANFRKEYQFIYSKGAQVDTDALDWTDAALTISNIFPLKTDRSQLMAYIIWPNNIKTVHLIQELHDKCPKKLCHFYEERIHFA